MSAALTTTLRSALVDAARLRLLLPDADPDEIRPFYGDQLDGFWVVPLLADTRGRVVVLQAEGDVVLPHAGLARAATRLRAQKVLDIDVVVHRLRAVLDAVGGLSPGSPRYPRERVEVTESGARLTFTEPESWVRFAAGGGIGPAPDGLGREPRGATPPEPDGEMVCSLSSAYELRWRYVVDGRDVGAHRGHPDEDLGDDVEPIDAERALATARRRLGSPLAMPTAPVGLDDHGRWRVELVGSDPVFVDPTEDGG